MTKIDDKVQHLYVVSHRSNFHFDFLPIEKINKTKMNGNIWNYILRFDSMYKWRWNKFNSTMISLPPIDAMLNPIFFERIRRKKKRSKSSNRMEPNCSHETKTDNMNLPQKKKMIRKCLFFRRIVSVTGVHASWRLIFFVFVQMQKIFTCIKVMVCGLCSVSYSVQCTWSR